MANFINLNSIFADEIGLNYGQLKLQRSPTQSTNYNFVFPPIAGTTGQALFWNGTETTFRGIAIADVANLQTNLNTINTNIANLNAIYAPIIHDHAGTIGNEFTINSDAANTGSDRSVSIGRSGSQTASYSLVLPPNLGTANQGLIINSISGNFINLGWGNVGGGFSNVSAYGIASVSIDLALGDMHVISLEQNTVITDISGVPSGKGAEFTIFCAQDAIGGKSLTFPSGTLVTGTISSSANTSSIIKLFSLNGGISWEAVVIKPLPNTISVIDWTPANITAGLWLDSSDGSTLAIGSGISQINDKSSNNRHGTQSSASKQPALISNAINGKNVVRFDGNDDALNFAGSFLNGTNYLIVLVAARRSNKTNNYFIGGSNPSASTNQILHLGWRSDTQITQAQWFNDLNINIAAYSTPEYDIWSFTHSSSSGKTIHRNGIWLGNSANTDGLNSYTSGLIGESHGNFFSGDFCELIILTGANVTDTNRQRLEGYLASPNRWSLQAKLDANHPYKSSHPTV